MIVQALGAIGAGISVLGFVILCGGAVIYVRLQATGLPAIEGVAHVPREVLVATGAEVLVPAALITLGVVGVLLSLDLLLKYLQSRKPDGVAALEAQLNDSEAELDELMSAQQEREEEAKTAHRAAGAAAQAAATAPQADAAQLDACQRQLAAASKTVASVELARSVVAAAEQRLQRQRVELARRRERDQRERRRGSTRRLVFEGAALLALEIAVIVIFLHTPHWDQMAFVLVTAFLTALMAFSIFSGTQQFAWFGVAAFVSIGIVFGMTKFFDTKNDARVAPVAVLRDGRAPIAGFLVADTGDVLLIGQGRGGATGREMLVMPRREVRDLVVGEVMKPDAANIAALVLLKRLCAGWTADFRGSGSAAAKLPRRQLCTSRERRRVAAEQQAATQDLTKHA